MKFLNCNKRGIVSTIARWAILPMVFMAVASPINGRSQEGVTYSIEEGGTGIFMVGKGQKIQLSDWAAEGEVMSSWSPNGRYVVIFVPHPRVTEVLVFDCESGKGIETSQKLSQYPAWFERGAVTEHSTPVKWTSESTLDYRSVVGLRGGGTRVMNVLLTVKPPVYSRQIE